ncbi:MAG: hypothetical protein NZM29_08390 [Nitrospira sp.]|nr:hypothetical protein [Nitrospira sp.]
MIEQTASAWERLCASLMETFPQLYRGESGGPLMMDLGPDGWLLEVKPEGAVVCQYGIALEDVMALMSEGTAEDLGTDEVAKQAKYYLQPAVSKFRPLLLQSGFTETTEMTDEFVAVTFTRTVGTDDPAKVRDLIRWCWHQIGKNG